MYKPLISPNDAVCKSSSDSQAIQNAVDLAVQSGVRRVVIPRVNARTGQAEWRVDRAVLLPSNIEIVLDNCLIRQEDGSMDNVFRNANVYTALGTSSEGEQENIVIRGVGTAVIDGGTPNGLTESTSLKEGRPHIIWNNTILLHNVRNFVLENFTIRNQRWWAINLIFARDGRLSNLTFQAMDNIPNQDGIDLRVGCHDILIENVFGQGGDDLIALSGFAGFEVTPQFGVADRDRDIYNVIVRNVVGTSVTKAIVALRNHDGIGLRNVHISGVYDTSGDERGNMPYAAVRIGQKWFYKKRMSTLGETRGIYVSDVHAAHGVGVMVNVTLEQSRFDGIYCEKSAQQAITTRTDTQREEQRGAKIVNTVFENIFGNRESASSKPLVEFCRGTGEDGLENVLVRNVFASGNVCPVRSDFDSGLHLEGIFGG